MLDILGIGECMIELDSEEPLCSSRSFTPQVGGDVYNTLVAASRLGCRAGFFTQIAMDSFGQALLRHFEENGIITRHVHKLHDGGVNGLYFTALQENGAHEFVYYRRNSAASRMTPAQITPLMIRQTKLLYSTGITQAISPTARETVLASFRMAKDYGVRVAYDPNFRSALWPHPKAALEAMEEILPFVDILLPSYEDAVGLLNRSDIAAMVSCFQSRGIPLIVLKQGALGARVISGEQQEIIPPFSTSRVRDTIGAGDAFNGGFLHSLLQGNSLTESARIGALVAAQSLRERGPIQGLPSGPEVSELLKENSEGFRTV